MHLALLLSVQTAAASLVSTNAQSQGGPGTGRVFSGRSGQLQVTAPRVEADVRIDGVLDEPVWQDAAVLRDFSQFDPNDGVPAADSTEVLIWYSPTAIHFGIRAYEAHGSVHGTLADRDRIGADDFIEILLGTFNDGRQATMFGVNPLGVQMDGAMVERGQSGGARERADLSPDFTWQSKGQLVPGGYVVEVRIPFKSLRFQPAREQTWTLNVTRQVQHSGYEDSWAPARRANASFLGQSGRLVGLAEIRRGLVVDVNPEVTSTRVGAPTGPGPYDYSGGDPQFGGNVRWGITNNLNLNGAFNPDFSQIESDAVAVHPHREPLGAADVRRGGAAVGQADGPVVQRTGDALAEDDALRQRSALVRALVEQGEHLVLGGAEDGDVAAAPARDLARAEARDVLDAADDLPVVHGRLLVLRPRSARTGARRPAPCRARTRGRAGRRARSAAARRGACCSPCPPAPSP